MRVRKKNESGESPKKPRLEVELHTPKLIVPKKKPQPPPPPPPPCKPKPGECVVRPECDPTQEAGMSLEDRCRALKAKLAAENPKKPCRPKHQSRGDFIESGGDRKGKKCCPP